MVTLMCFPAAMRSFLYGKLRRANRRIGPHDLWVAACSLNTGIPLLSRNTGEFSRVPDLGVVAYA